MVDESERPARAEKLPRVSAARIIVVHLRRPKRNDPNELPRRNSGRATYSKGLRSGPQPPVPPSGTPTVHHRMAMRWWRAPCDSVTRERPRLNEAPGLRFATSPRKGAQILIERRRAHWDRLRPHSSLGCRPPITAPPPKRYISGLPAGCRSDSDRPPPAPTARAEADTLTLSVD